MHLGSLATIVLKCGVGETRSTEMVAVTERCQLELGQQGYFGHMEDFDIREAI